MRDYWQTARNQGCSGYVAGLYERHALAAIARGSRPMPCNRWIAALERGVTHE